MSAINYSKWDHIEISDDEDDTHPNIDTPSLFRWRHQARVERMDQEKHEKEKLSKEKQDHQQKLQQMKQKLKESEEQSAMENFDKIKKETNDLEKQEDSYKKEDLKIYISAMENLDKIKKEINDLEKQEESYKKKEEDLKKKERLTPWNIDTICKEGKSKTLINKITEVKKEAVTDEEKAQRQSDFNKNHKDKAKKFGMLRRYEDSKDHLMKYPELVCEETANYLVLWCIDLEIEEKHDLMSHVSHQTIVMQFILELATQLKHDPRDCVRPFFDRITLAQKEYMTAFNDELEGFKGRVRARAKQKIDEAIAEHEEEEKQKRLGPGGLDPVEVFEELPQVLKDCFESKDISMLQEAVLKMPKEEAEYHMKRCVDSGLWVPNAQDLEGGGGDGEGEGKEEGEGGGDQEEEEEEVYEEVN